MSVQNVPRKTDSELNLQRVLERTESAFLSSVLQKNEAPLGKVRLGNRFPTGVSHESTS